MQSLSLLHLQFDEPLPVENLFPIVVSDLHDLAGAEPDGHRKEDHHQLCALHPQRNPIVKCKNEGGFGVSSDWPANYLPEALN